MSAWSDVLLRQSCGLTRRLPRPCPAQVSVTQGCCTRAPPGSLTQGCPLHLAFPALPSQCKKSDLGLRLRRARPRPLFCDRVSYLVDSTPAGPGLGGLAVLLRTLSFLGRPRGWGSREMPLLVPADSDRCSDHSVVLWEVSLVLCRQGWGLGRGCRSRLLPSPQHAPADHVGLLKP